MVVLLFDESNTTDGVIIGTHSTATWKQTDRLHASGGAPTPSVHDLTEAVERLEGE